MQDECSHCTAVLLYPVSSLEKAYTAEYYISNYQHIVKNQSDESNKIFKLIRKYTLGKSILDYGCGSGVFLKKASEFDFYDNIGVDVSLSAIDFAKKSFK
jgi:methylase of polypeptide subunit release factors